MSAWEPHVAAALTVAALCVIWGIAIKLPLGLF